MLYLSPSEQSGLSAATLQSRIYIYIYQDLQRNMIFTKIQ